MTGMKKYFDEKMDEINQQQEPIPEMPEEVAERIFARICLFCECGEIMMQREYNEDGIVEHIHCPNCERHYSTLVDPSTDQIALFETGESWLEYWCQNN
jgi:hypothetical protein